MSAYDQQHSSPSVFACFTDTFSPPTPFLSFLLSFPTSLLRWAFEDSAALRKELTTLVGLNATVVPVMVDGSYVISDWVVRFI